jgi:hypothetical protein
MIIEMDEINTLTREQLDAIGQGIADLSLRIDVAKHEMLTQLRKFDEHDGWANSGFVSLPAWLAWRIDIGPVAAREYVRVARALGELKVVDAAFAGGKLSYSKVRAITRVATVESEQDFLDISTNATASQIERLSAAYRRTRVDPKEPPLDQRRFVRRTETPSGMVRLEAQLPPEQAAIVWDALSAAVDAGRGQEAGTPSDAGRGHDAGTPPHASAETSTASGAKPEFDPAALPAERADALVSVAQAYLTHSPRTLGSGYELVLMSTKDQLENGAAGIGGYLRDGTPVPLHVARMLACDCSRVDVEVSQSGEILDVGRARRTIPSAIGRALWLRDGGCRAPGCGRRHHLHAHHIEEWAEGGKTSLSNLVLLCPGHHLQVHEGNLSVAVREGKLEFQNRYGLKLDPVPGRSDDFDAIERWLHTTEPGFDGAGTPVWDGSRLHLGGAIDWLYRAQDHRDRATC